MPPWVGITPAGATQKDRERAEIQKLAKTDFQAYNEAMKAWGARIVKNASAKKAGAK